MRLLRSLTLGAAVAAWIVTTAATAPTPELGPQPTQVAVWPRGGVDVGGEPAGKGATSVVRWACWTEKWEDVDTAETLCGDPSSRPAGSLDLGAQVLVNGRPWVATITGLEPVGQA